MLRSERLAAEVLVASAVCEDGPSALLPAAASDRAPGPEDPADLVPAGARGRRAHGPLALSACRGPLGCGRLRGRCRRHPRPTCRLVPAVLLIVPLLLAP
eukprot:4877955-Pyramimonas_sp.AAC.1